MGERICSVEGCERVVLCKGLCHLHYYRVRNGYRGPIPTKDRFWSKVDRTSGCWLWTATVNNQGYGMFGLAGSMVLAHRWAYEDMVGPIPEGLVIDHLCRVKPCVNPAHLETVTQRVNSQRGIVGGRSGPNNANRLKTHCPQDHPYDEANTYRDKNGRRCRTCARIRANLAYHSRPR